MVNKKFKMKKILLAGLVLLFCNCSKDNEAQQDDSLNGTLLKKIVYIDDSGNKEEYSLAYEKNKLTSITLNSNSTQFNGNLRLFTYSNDIITKITTFNNDELYSIEEYNYKNGKVDSYSIDYLKDPYKERTTYTYNTDSSVTFNEFSTYKPTDQESKDATGKLFYDNGNIIKVEKFENVEFEYDNHLNPLKNILGFNLLLDKLPYFFGAGAVNNCTKISEIDLIPTPSTITTEFEYSYNEKGYPKSAKVKHTEDKIITTSTIQYFY